MTDVELDGDVFRVRLTDGTTFIEAVGCVHLEGNAARLYDFHILGSGANHVGAGRLRDLVQ